MSEFRTSQSPLEHRPAQADPVVARFILVSWRWIRRVVRDGLPSGAWALAMADKHIPELTDQQRARIWAAGSDINEMTALLRAGTATPDDVAGALNRLLSTEVNRDALHIPPDASMHAESLERILRRIPDGWGRWFRHDAGWYPISIACEQQLAALDGDYVVYQVKEKFGTLHYYCEPSAERRTELWERFTAITDAAERQSTITCERCGQPGVLHRLPHWVKTLCAVCAADLGYVPES